LYRKWARARGRESAVCVFKRRKAEEGGKKRRPLQGTGYGESSRKKQLNVGREWTKVKRWVGS